MSNRDLQRSFRNRCNLTYDLHGDRLGVFDNTCYGKSGDDYTILDVPLVFQARAVDGYDDLIEHSIFGSQIGVTILRPPRDGSYQFPESVDPRFVLAYQQWCNPPGPDLSQSSIEPYTVSVLQFYQDPVRREGKNVGVVLTAWREQTVLPHRRGVHGKITDFGQLPDPALVTGSAMLVMTRLRSQDQFRRPEEIAGFNEAGDERQDPIQHMALVAVGTLHLPVDDAVAIDRALNTQFDRLVA